jgi:DNA-binding NtrC family response regulator
VQAKLLRVLETGEVQRVGSLRMKKVDVRVIAATNRDLKLEAAAGRFRPDLYYRLNVVELTVPPLRARAGDIPYLTAAFVSEFAKRFHRPLEGVSPGAERILVSAAWPGNVRELRNVLERACMLAERRVLAEGDLPLSLPDSAHGGVIGAPSPLLAVHRHGKEEEMNQIRQALADANGNKRRAAARLGVSARTFYRRLHEHGLIRAGQEETNSAEDDNA